MSTATARNSSWSNALAMHVAAPCNMCMYSYSEISFALASCAVDNGTRYIHTMTNTQRFQLIPFRWIKNYTLVYLHCNVIVCHKDQPSRCSKGCHSPNPRRTRSTGNEEEHSVTLGPVMLRGTQRSESSIVYKGKSDAQFICRRLNVFLMLSFIESLVTGSVVECFIDQIVAGWTSVGIGELRNFFRLQLVFWLKKPFLPYFQPSFEPFFQTLVSWERRIYVTIDTANVTRFLTNSTWVDPQENPIGLF